MVMITRELCFVQNKKIWFTEPEVVLLSYLGICGNKTKASSTLVITGQESTLYIPHGLHCSKEHSKAQIKLNGKPYFV